MKFIYNYLFLLAFIIFSCNDTEEVEVEDLSEAPIEEQAAVASSVEFSIQGVNGIETDINIDFQNQSQNLSDFTWDFGDGTIVAEKQPQHMYSSPGKYTVTLTGRSADGRDLSFSKDMYVRKSGAELDILYVSFSDSVNTLNFFDLSANSQTVLYEVPNNPGGVLAFDQENNKVYYYDYDNSAIIENSTEVNNPVVLISNLAGVSDMDFDPGTGELFIAVSFDNMIYRYTPGSLELTPAYTTVTNSPFGRVRDMDLKAGKLYTITPAQSYESVFRVDLAGDNIRQLIDYQEGGYGYGVAFDDLNDKIYFNNVEEAALMRSDRIGNNIEKVIDLDRFGTVSFAGLALTGLEVVETRNQVMWSSWEDGTLYIMNIETLEEEVVKAPGMIGKFVPFENDGLSGILLN